MAQGLTPRPHSDRWRPSTWCGDFSSSPASTSENGGQQATPPAGSPAILGHKKPQHLQFSGGPHRCSGLSGLRAQPHMQDCAEDEHRPLQDRAATDAPGLLARIWSHARGFYYSHRPLTSCMTLSKLLDLSEPTFICETEDNRTQSQPHRMAWDQTGCANRGIPGGLSAKLYQLNLQREWGLRSAMVFSCVDVADSPAKALDSKLRELPWWATLGVLCRDPWEKRLEAACMGLPWTPPKRLFPGRILPHYQP